MGSGNLPFVTYMLIPQKLEIHRRVRRERRAVRKPPLSNLSGSRRKTVVTFVIYYGEKKIKLNP